MMHVNFLRLRELAEIFCYYKVVSRPSVLKLTTQIIRCQQERKIKHPRRDLAICFEVWSFFLHCFRRMAKVPLTGTFSLKSYIEMRDCPFCHQ